MSPGVKRSKVLYAAEVLLMAVTAQAGYAVTVTPDELWEARRWAAAKLVATAERAPPEARISVVANNDPVQKNARLGLPLRIGKREHWRGLFCHAYSKLIVRLPGPGRKLEAIVGVDSNEQTVGGRGSVVFSVAAGGQELFRSEVMREGMPGVPVSVDLGGAKEFVLEVGDAGDGISCDQADWAEARVTMADGSVLWLGDMALEDPHRPVPSTEPPFSFTYGGQAWAELLTSWELQRDTRKLDDNRSEHTLTYTEAKTGLVVRCVAVEYHDFPVIEWTLYFRNTGAADTPILAEVQALDTWWQHYAWPQRERAEYALHHFTGSPCSPSDYEPQRTTLGPKAEKRITAAGGRPTNSDLCYFNVGWPSEGVIVAVGWPGQWAAQFSRDEGTGLRVRIGQELTHFRLHPGEEVRTPLIAMLFWKGDWIRGQNLWRRWMLAHNLPRPGGKLPPCPEFAACSSPQFGEMVNANEENQKLFIDRYVEEGLKIDYWWMDAGWYVNESGWPNTGTWEVDRKRFPGGLRAISDYAHAKGIKCIVWFEPERVTPGTWLYQNHPEWLLGREGEQKLLNLGNPQARQWLVEHVDRLITEQGIDLYRNDFNMDPLAYWRANDAEERQGITEIRYATGFLAYWDELRRRHPNMLIDTCASGGRRNDLETLRRSVPLHRSDYIFESVGSQCHTYGLAFWVPFYGIGTMAEDPYCIRSMLCPHFTGGWDVRRRDLDYELLRRMIAQWQRVAPYFMGDYYPLTGYSLENDVWMAWQFDRPDLGEGMVQVFRRADSVYEAGRLRLRGLEPDARYRLTDLDAGRSKQMTGLELMEQGLPVALKERPAAVIITYQRVKARRPRGEQSMSSPTAVEYEPQGKLAADPQRPRYHFLPPANWMNDPNGLMQFEGNYHLFYQHNPKGPFAADMHWGHAESRDLVHWRHLPIALAPTPGGPDKEGCWSGCGVIANGVPTLVYTGVHPEVQCIATGSQDMLTWRKYERNPVIGAPPEGLEVMGFRDPCVWREGDTWYMVLGSGIKGVGGTALLYRSANLRDWEYVHPICVGDKSQSGEMWECPNFFPLGDKHVLLASVLGTVLYFVGTWSDFKFTPQLQGDTDFGGSFYAAQVFPDARGRRIMFGWLRENRSDAAQREAGWSGVMSLPRIVYLRKDGDLGIKPAPEVEMLRGEHYRRASFEVSAQSPQMIAEAGGDCVEIMVEADLGEADEFGVKVRCSPDGQEETLIVYSAAGKRLAVNRERSSSSAEVARDVRGGPLELAEGEPLRLRIFLDRSVLEVFANERACLTSRIYPTRADSLGVGLFAVGGKAKVKRLDVWQMKSIWPSR